MKFLIALALAVLVFGVGVLAGAIFHIGDPVVKVAIENRSSREIARVLLSHEHGTAISVRPIPPGQSATLRFWSPAETSFSCAITFADGSAVDCRGGYAEAGYKFNEVVSDAGVRQTLEPFDGFRPHFGG